jgi:RimJ/RimL family protein N-acetyltransferase
VSRRVAHACIWAGIVATCETNPAQIAERGRAHDVAVALLLSDDVILLRQLTPDDVDEWMADEDAAPRNNVERAIADWADSWRTGGSVRHWAICDQETDRIVGGVELSDLGDGNVNLSSVVFRAWRRRGIATRACRLALAYAAQAMDCRAAIFKVPQGNAASIALARRLGATVTGIEMTGAGDLTTVLRLDLESAG